MDLGVAWSLAETIYSFAAVAALAVMWIVWRRAPRGAETAWLCSSILALCVCYGCHAVDAAQHATGIVESHTTVWAAFGQAALVIASTLFSAFLLAVATRVYAPSRPDAWLVWGIVIPVSIAALLALSGLGRLLWTLVVNQGSEVVAAEVRRIVGHAGSIATKACFALPISCFDALFAKVPTPQHARWVRWLTEGGTWQTVAHRDDVGADVRPSSRATRRFRRAALLFLFVAWALSMQWMHDLQRWPSLALGLPVVLRVFLLPSLLALVYYQARFVFFDVLVTRGIVAGLVAVGVTATAFLLDSVTRWPLQQAWLAEMSVATTILLVTSGRAIHGAQQSVGQRVFRRPNYSRALPSTTTAMAACPTVEDLATVVTTRLGDTLGATSVHYSTESRAGAEVVVGLGPPSRPRGYLQLGPRRRGQPYGSEDLTFVAAVAAHMGSLLEAFDARESARLASEAELKALRAQINPHFLFNALSTLAEMAHDQPATERAIVNLSRVFRYALTATLHERVPLGSEIEAIQAYLEIQAERFHDHLRFEIDVPASLWDVPMPPMLLQPLVENAVIHGLSPRLDGGTVRVGAGRENGHLHLTVQDDGVGFDVNRSALGVGLSNVRTRVERTGGWWRVQSISGVGTEVTLVVVTA